MNKFLLGVLLFGLQLSAAAQSNGVADPSTSRIRQLYVCNYFYDAGSRSADKALREKSSQLAGQFLLKATSSAIDRGNEALANSLAAEARAEFARFIENTRSMSSSEQTVRLAAFDADCSSLLNAKIESAKKDRSPERATRLYFCANVYSGLGNDPDFVERDQYLALSKDMLVRAESVASANGQRAIDPILQQDGKAQADAWSARLSPIEKTKLLSKIKRLCTAASRDPAY
jgi:hypothetical protein